MYRGCIIGRGKYFWSELLEIAVRTEEKRTHDARIRTGMPVIVGSSTRWLFILSSWTRAPLAEACLRVIGARVRPQG